MRLPDEIHRDDLVLRRWRTDDADVEALDRAIVASLDHLRPWMPWIANEPLSLNDRRQLIDGWTRQWEDGGDVVLGIFEEDVAVGSCGLHHRGDPDTLHIGYWVHFDHVRRGIATRAARALTEMAFTVPGIEWVEIHHDQANVASAGVPRRLGFALVAETPDEIDAPGEIGTDCSWRTDRWSWTAVPDRHLSAG
jgi:ribosomal-protein-serine acetyltransferase